MDFPTMWRTQKNRDGDPKHIQYSIELYIYCIERYIPPIHKSNTLTDASLQTLVKCIEMHPSNTIIQFSSLS